jgi:hypothetical protein
MTHLIQLCAPNDRNGNPRRLYLEISGDGEAVQHWEEGYSGHHCVPVALRGKAARAVRINVSASEWNSWRKACPEGK